MPSDVTCFHVAIIGPSDTSKEVVAAKQAISELSSSLSKRGVTLVAHHWTALPPGIGEPQGYIDESLAWADIDFVIGLMKHKFGSPVQDADSGTDHEVKIILRLHEATGTPDLLFYFHKDALHKSSQIDAFAESLRKRALTSEYSTISALKASIKEHLEAKVHLKSAAPSGVAKIRGHLPTNRRITVEWIISARMTDGDLPIPTLVCLKNGKGEEFIFDARIPLQQEFANWVSLSMGFAAKKGDFLLHYLTETNLQNAKGNNPVGVAQCWLGHMELILHKKLGAGKFQIAIGQTASKKAWPKLKKQLEQGYVPLPTKEIVMSSEGGKEYKL